MNTLFDAMERVTRLNMNASVTRGSYDTLAKEGVHSRHIAPWIMPGGDTRMNAPLPRLSRILLCTRDGDVVQSQYHHLRQAAFWPDEATRAAAHEGGVESDILRRILFAGLFESSVHIPPSVSPVPPDYTDSDQAASGVAGRPYGATLLNKWLCWLLSTWDDVVHELDVIRECVDDGKPVPHWIPLEVFSIINPETHTGVCDFAQCGGVSDKHLRIVRAAGATWLWPSTALSFARYITPSALCDPSGTPRDAALFGLAWLRMGAWARIAHLSLDGIPSCATTDATHTPEYGPVYSALPLSAGTPRDTVPESWRGMFKRCDGVSTDLETIRKAAEAASLLFFDAHTVYASLLMTDFVERADDLQRGGGKDLVFGGEWETTEQSVRAEYHAWAPDERRMFFEGSLPEFEPGAILSCSFLSGNGFDNRQSTSVSPASQRAGPTFACMTASMTAASRAATRNESRNIYAHMWMVVKHTYIHIGDKQRKKMTTSKEDTKTALHLLDVVLKSISRRCRKRRFLETLKRMLIGDAVDRVDPVKMDIIVEALVASLRGDYTGTAKPLHGQLRTWVLTHLLMPLSTETGGAWSRGQIRRWILQPGIVRFVRQSLYEMVRYTIRQYPAMDIVEKLTRVGRHYDHYCGWSVDAFREIVRAAWSSGSTHPFTEEEILDGKASLCIERACNKDVCTGSMRAFDTQPVRLVEVTRNMDTLKLHSGDTTPPIMKDAREFVHKLARAWTTRELQHACAEAACVISHKRTHDEKVHNRVHECLREINLSDLPPGEKGVGPLFPPPEEWGPSDTATYWDRLVPGISYDDERQIHACVDVLLPSIEREPPVEPAWTWLRHFGVSTEAVLLFLEAYACYAHPRSEMANYMSILLATRQELMGRASIFDALRRLRCVAASRVGGVLVVQLAMRARVDIEQCVRDGVEPETLLMKGARQSGLRDYVILREVVRAMDGFWRFMRILLPRPVAIAQERILRRISNLPDVDPNDESRKLYELMATHYVCTSCGRPKFADHDVISITNAEEQNRRYTLSEMYDGIPLCCPISKKTTPDGRQRCRHATRDAVTGLPRVWGASAASRQMRIDIASILDTGDMQRIDIYAAARYYTTPHGRSRSALGAAVLDFCLRGWLFYAANARIGNGVHLNALTPASLTETLSALRKNVNGRLQSIFCSTRALVPTSFVGTALVSLYGTHMMCCVCARIFVARAEFSRGPYPLCAAHSEDLRARLSGISIPIRGVDVARAQPAGGVSPFRATIEHAGEGFVPCLQCRQAALPVILGGEYIPVIVYVNRDTLFARICEREYNINPDAPTDCVYAWPSTTKGLGHGGTHGFVRRYLCPIHASVCSTILELQSGVAMRVVDGFHCYLQCSERRETAARHHIGLREHLARCAQDDRIENKMKHIIALSGVEQL